VPGTNGFNRDPIKVHGETMSLFITKGFNVCRALSRCQLASRYVIRTATTAQQDEFSVEYKNEGKLIKLQRASFVYLVRTQSISSIVT